ENLIKIRTRQDNAGNWRVAQSIVRMKEWICFDLIADVGRNIQQEPAFSVRTDGNLQLGPRLALEGAIPQGPAIAASTVPLGKAAARGGSEDVDIHAEDLELGAGVRIDLAAKLNLFKNRCGPGHYFPLGEF